MLSRARRVANAQAAQPFAWGDDSQTAGAIPPDARHALGRATRVPAHQAQASAPPQMALAEIEREAFASGYAQGEKAGFETGAHRAEAMLRRLAATIDELTTLRRSLVAQTERELVQLALAVARRIVNREVSIDRDLVVTIARIALERLGGATTATIRLHPDDYAAVVERHGEAWAGVRVQVVADDSISRGGCKVESEVGFIDASIDAQFAEIAGELVGSADDALEGPHGRPGVGTLP